MSEMERKVLGRVAEDGVYCDGDWGEGQRAWWLSSDAHTLSDDARKAIDTLYQQGLVDFGDWAEGETVFITDLGRSALEDIRK